MSIRIRDVHWETMYEHMTAYPEFCQGRLNNSPENRKVYNKMWSELAEKLNFLGYGQSPVDKWQKSWGDYKVNLKKKASEIHRNRNLTGGGPGPHKELSDFEQQILGILGGTFYKGVGEKECGLPQHVKSVVQSRDGVHNISTSNTSSTTPTTQTHPVTPVQRMVSQEPYFVMATQRPHPWDQPSTSENSNTKELNTLEFVQQIPFRRTDKGKKRLLGNPLSTKDINIDHDYLPKISKKIYL